MFENESEGSAGIEAPPHRQINWSQVRGRLGLAAVALLLFGSAGIVLTIGVKLYLSALNSPVTTTAPAVPAAPAPPAPSVPVATVAVRTAGTPLSERSGPSTDNTVRGHLANGATVGVLCQVYGQKLTGPAATSAWWEVDAHGRYISDAYLTWSQARPEMPWCGVNSHRAVLATAHVGYDGLSIRTGPSASDRKVGTEVNGAVLTVICRRWGETVSGTEGRTSTWSELGDGEFVSDAFVHWSPQQPFMPWCGETPRIVPPSTVKAFIAAAVAPARASMALYDVPAAVTIAQAILESGAGASDLTQIDHAVFGMKCFGDPGSVAVGCRDYGTHECTATGRCYATSASFRVYRNEADSFADHGLLLGTTPRYRPALAFANNPDKFAKAIQKAGYATSPKYAVNLISVMQRYDLYQYDKPVTTHRICASVPEICTPADADAD